MGYTHYFRINTPLEKPEFKKLVVDVRKLIKASAKKEVFLADGNGSVGTSPYIKDDAIIFNGMDFSKTGGENGSYETFYLPQKAKGFNFCKTARLPYDLVVMAVLIALKKHFPSVSISSNGESEEWKEGIEFCDEVLGYGANFDITIGDFDDDIDDRKVVTKEEIIDLLVSSELDVIRQEIIQDRDEYLTNIIRKGVGGLEALTNYELEARYYQATDESVKIKE